jgi:hypothetical protein
MSSPELYQSYLKKGSNKDEHLRSRGADIARVVHVPSPNKGVGNAGCPPHPQPRVQKCK